MQALDGAEINQRPLIVKATRSWQERGDLPW